MVTAQSCDIREVAVLVAVIVACEVGFWVVLAAGLACRYLLHRRRLGGWLLACVPLVDLVLLVATVVDLPRGAEASWAHGLAALYLGSTAVFGHRAVRWADVRAAHRFAGGPPPAPKPRSGTPARARLEWEDFARAALAAATSAVLLLAAVWLVGDRGDTGPLWAWLPRMGTVLVVWLVGWPLWESARVLTRPRRA